MLDSNGMIVAQGVQLDSVEWTRDGFEIPRSAQPAFDRTRALQGFGQSLAGFDLGRTAGNRAERCCQGKEVEMMIMETRQECTAPCIDFGLTALGSDVIGKLGDDSACTAKIEAALADFGIANQQGAVQFASNVSSGAASGGARPSLIRARGFSIAEVCPASTTHQPCGPGSRGSSRPS